MSLAPWKFKMHLCFLVALLVLNVFLASGQKFNAFKSYKNARVKPRNYGSVERRDHDIGEYLTVEQIRMMRKRKGRDEPEDMFDPSKPIGVRTDTSRRLTEANEIFDLSPMKDWLILQPPKVFTPSWWLYVSMMVTISLFFISFSAVMLVLCCLALHPARKMEQDDVPKKVLFDLEKFCVDTSKDAQV
ncbi:hypothetical protein EON65_58215 [archaeon]|nr:MAG: hypothetical protein EON65_58215 [archaeon]